MGVRPVCGGSVAVQNAGRLSALLAVPTDANAIGTNFCPLSVVGACNGR